MIRVVKPKNDVVLSDGIFLRRGAVRKVDISDHDWKIIAPVVVDLTETGVEQNSAPATVESVADGEKDIPQKPKRGKKQTVEK